MASLSPDYIRDLQEQYGDDWMSHVPQRPAPWLGESSGSTLEIPNVPPYPGAGGYGSPNEPAGVREAVSSAAAVAASSPVPFLQCAFHVSLSIPFGNSLALVVLAFTPRQRDLDFGQATL